jgi:beta-mannosidase
LKTIDLSGKWDVVSSCNQYNWKGDVPGSVLYDMEKSGHLGEGGAFYRSNNRKAPELMDRDFIYRTTIELSDDFYDHYDKSASRIVLEADGLDTLAEIKVNNILVAKTKNMHRSYSFDIADVVKPGENSIEITFLNSLEYIKNEHAIRPLMAEDPEGITTIPGFYSIRKSHCSYGWDWGPQIPDAGIWRAIRIVRYDDCRFNDLRITQDHFPDHVILNISAETDNWGRDDFLISGSVISPSGDEIPYSFSAGGNTNIKIDNPQLWWPNGMGEQHLYTVLAELTVDGVMSGSITRNVGLRTLTIARKPDEWGETFHFEANGIPLFARGANYIPEDIYLNRMNEKRTERLLSDCREANFNCIRVWGGGVYPDDYFYDLCDRYGLIVWQDMMFACAIYDMLSDEFTENISEEIRDNLKRIRHHASLGLICGNNEMEWFFVDYDTFPQTKENEFEYIKQYHMVIPEIHKEICPEIFYWSSSPSSGGYFEEPNSPDKGDCHFWEVWHGNKDLSEYKNHYFRFMSEFGFESLPSIKTIESFTAEDDRNIFSPVMEEHQKRVGGNPKIVSYLSKYFRYPKDLDSLSYVSQLSQSDAIRVGVEHWRRNRGRCMGSIYWQLNDNWPVASWSSIDYYGRWKALHYAVKRAYDNILLSIDGEGREAVIHLSNESNELTRGTLSIRLVSLDGTVLNEQSLSVECQSWSSAAMHTFELEEGISPGTAVLSAVYHCEEGNYEAVHFFEIYKYFDLKKPEITFAFSNLDNERSELTLYCDKPAIYVELDLIEGDCIFSDNYFHLFPGDEKKIQIRHEGNSPASGESFRIRSLVDSY